MSVSELMTRAFSFGRNLLFRRDADVDLDEEIRAHLTLLVDEKVRSGMAPAEARRAAALEFGGVESVKEQVRYARSGAVVDSVIQDVRYGVRSLQRRPVFAFAAISTLALGIGANTAIFTIADELLFRPPPYLHGERLVQVIGMDRPNGGGGNNLNAHRLLTWQNQGLFERLEGFAPQQFDVSGNGEPERVRGYVTTTGFFSMLGANAALGRTFTAGDGRTGGERLVLLTHGVWSRRFGGAADVVGRTMMLNEEPYRIVGVMPRRFTQFQDGVWIPFDLSRHDDDSTISNFVAYGRLPAGGSVETTQVRANELARTLNESDPQPRGWYLGLTTLKAAYVSDGARVALFVLLGAVGFVLLIACANVANLLLVRAVVREREMLVRSSLGASRARLVRQMLIEGALLSIAGGICGLAVAWLGVRALVAITPADTGFIEVSAVDFGIDGRILAFTAALTFATGLLFGIGPAIRSSRPSIDHSIRGAASGRAHSSGRVPSTLVVTAVALSLVLLIGAGLMIGTFARLSRLNPGFNLHGVIAVEIGLPTDRYPTPLVREEFFETLITNITRVHGVVDAACGTGIPPGVSGFSTGVVEAEGIPRRLEDAPEHQANLSVTPGYFRALGIPVVAGRSFRDDDPSDSVIINESLARRLSGNSTAVGRRIRAWETARWTTVVGVVGDVELRIGDLRLLAQLYYPINRGSMQPQPGTRPPAGRTFVSRWLIIRAADPVSALPAIKSHIWNIDKALPLQRMELASDLWAQTFAFQRFILILMGTFAAIAVILAVGGLFSVISHSVVHRTNEIGIRMALGAPSWHVLGLIMRQGAIVVTLGIVVGLAAAAATTRYLQAVLVDLSPLDPATFVAVTLLFGLVAVVASFLPARRATKVDPMVAVRAE